MARRGRPGAALAALAVSGIAAAARAGIVPP
jgi:hypothetical protein